MMRVLILVLSVLIALPLWADEKHVVPLPYAARQLLQALSLENPTAATAFANEVEKCYTALEQMPYLYEQCRDPRLSSKGYRKAVIKHYLLIYRVDEAQKTVYLLRFFYGRQNYDTLL